MKHQRRQLPPLSGEDSKPPQVVHVGIIFVLGDRVLIESTPITEGEVYGEFVNHINNHEDFWAYCQASGLAPKDEDYISAPRGRVVFNRVTGPVLYLDRCIIKNPALVREIKQRLHLPARVEISTDPHYRCEHCLSRSPL